jgi:Acetyltransferase (GNAT) domain
MEVSCNPGSEIEPNVWDAFVEYSEQGNVYQMHTYLTHVMPSWQVIMVKDGTEIVAAFPFAMRAKYGLKYALQPYFSQYMGILFAQKSDNTYKNLEFQKKAIQLIHEAIPKEISLLKYNFAPEFTYDLPLLWQGWKQETLHTYWADVSNGYPAFMAACASHVRREAKKAQQSGIEVRVEVNPELVLDILKRAKPESIQSFSKHDFDALCQNVRHYAPLQKSCCFIAYEAEKPIAGIIYFFHGKKMIYYQGSTLPEYKNSGAMTLIITESVRLFGEKYSILDFDGSMIEPIERFLRGFGAYPVRYSRFTLNKLPWPVRVWKK